MIQDKGVTIDGGEVVSLQEGFEGPEKNLQVVFRLINNNNHSSSSSSSSVSLRRDINRSRWDAMLELAKCKILSVLHGDSCDAYVLSESSLFVYDRRVILKTCGTTRLLQALDDIVAIGASLGLGLRAVFYSRKNFTFSHLQHSPHGCFADEVAFLEQRFSGSSTVVGPTDGDHWCFYLADFGNNVDDDDDDDDDLHLDLDLDNEEEESLPISFFEVKMHEIHPDSAALFIEREGVSGKDVTVQSGIGALIPGETIDEHQFSPCGYSMNGLISECYSTIHITPEPHCSYVSFETNLPIAHDPLSRDALLNNVLAIFRPATFSVTVVHPFCLARCPSVTPPRGYNYCFQPVERSLNGALSLITWSFALCDPESHPLGCQSIKRLMALASQNANNLNNQTIVVASSPAASASSSASLEAGSFSALPSFASPTMSPSLLLPLLDQADTTNTLPLPQQQPQQQQQQQQHPEQMACSQQQQQH